MASRAEGTARPDRRTGLCRPGWNMSKTRYCYAARCRIRGTRLRAVVLALTALVSAFADEVSVAIGSYVKGAVRHAW